MKYSYETKPKQFKFSVFLPVVAVVFLGTVAQYFSAQVAAAVMAGILVFVGCYAYYIIKHYLTVYIYTVDNTDFMIEQKTGSRQMIKAMFSLDDIKEISHSYEEDKKSILKYYTDKKTKKMYIKSMFDYKQLVFEIEYDVGIMDILEQKRKEQ